MTATSRLASRAGLTPLLLLLLPLLLLALAGCAGSAGSADGGASSADTAGAAGAAVAADEAGANSGLAVAGADDAANQAGDAAAADSQSLVVPGSAAVISTGDVVLRAGDVTRLGREVQQVVDTVGGQVTGRSSTTDDDGVLASSRVVLRVPAERFDEALDRLAGLGTLVSSNASSEDVTTQVIDTDARVATQRAGVQRVRQLLASATDLQQVIAIESQLTERQAALESLEQTQAYLADQTARSTITVSMERSSRQAEAAQEASFLTGLRDGWEALAGFAAGLGVVVGAVLPWLVVAGGLALLARLLARLLAGPLTRWLRRRPTAGAGG